MGKGSKRNNFILKSLAILCCLISPQMILAAAADLDTNFDVDGKVIVDFNNGNDICREIAIQPDGKILAAGRAISTSTTMDFAVARFNTDGSLDSFFGSSGRVRTDFAATDDEAWAIALQSDGKIVLAGSTFSGGSYVFALVRYDMDGELDPTFGTNGKVTTDFGDDVDSARGTAIQADGRIVVAGNMFNSNTGQGNFALARYNPDGSLDSSFGFGGKVTTDIPGFDNDQMHDMVLRPDGKIVVAGRSISGTHYDFVLTQYNPDGSLDSSFSSDGIATTDFAGFDDEGFGIALQTDGKVVVVGSTQVGSSYDFALVRYTTDGELDSTFNFDGKVTIDFTNSVDQATGVAVQSDGKIIASGYSTLGAGSGLFAIARYNTDGSPDNDFGTNGRVLTGLNASDVALAVKVQSDGKIVAAGYTTDAQLDFALARYLGDPPPPPPPTCLFCDDFQDGVIAANWTYVKPLWNEAAGNLVGIPSTRKAETVADPAFAGCSVCSVEASMSTLGGSFGKLWLLGWYVDKKNTIEVLMKEENDKWILKQRAGGRIVAKTKGIAPILPNTFYNVEVAFDGSNFALIVDGVTLAMMPAASIPNGTVGFRVKGTTGSFGFIEVE